MRPLSSRQQDILDAIIEQYIGNVVPISSEFLQKVGRFNVSSATLRAEMAALERFGYLVQPHTSAGRIPTDEAYRAFVERQAKGGSLSDKIKEKLSGFANMWRRDKVQALERAVDETAAYSHGASIVGMMLGDQAIFLQRLSNLRAQPEFHSYEVASEMLGVIDALQKRRADVSDMAEPGITRAFIGRDIRMGRVNSLSMIVRSWRNRPAGYSGFIATIGPIRMHYEKAFPAIDFFGDIFSTFDE